MWMSMYMYVHMNVLCRPISLSHTVPKHIVESDLASIELYLLQWQCCKMSGRGNPHYQYTNPVRRWHVSAGIPPCQGPAGDVRFDTNTCVCVLLSGMITVWMQTTVRLVLVRCEACNKPYACYVQDKHTGICTVSGSRPCQFVSMCVWACVSVRLSNKIIEQGWLPWLKLFRVFAQCDTSSE